MDDYRLTPGGVIHAYCHTCTPPKDKFFLIGVIEPTPLLLVINSRLNRYVEERPHLHGCNVQINSGSYSFLKHDSWVSCCEAHTAISYDDLTRELKYNDNAAHGCLSASDLQAVIAAIDCSPVMVRKHKRVLLAALKPLVL